MIRIIFGLVLILELVSTAFTFKLHNGKLIEHREWKTGDAILQVKDSTDKNQVKSARSVFKEMKKADFTENKDEIVLQNRVITDEESTGVVGAETVINGSIYAHIENFHSSTTKTYKLYSKFCLTKNCAETAYTIQLDPGGYFELRVKRALTFTIETPGDYNPFLSTLVDGDDLTNVFGTSDIGFIEIVN